MFDLGPDLKRNSVLNKSTNCIFLSFNFFFINYRALNSFEESNYEKAFKSLDSLEVINREKVVQAPNWQYNNMIAKSTKSLLKAYAQLHMNNSSGNNHG